MKHTFQDYIRAPVTAPPRRRDIILSNKVEDVIHYVDWLKGIVDPTVPFWRNLYEEYDKYFEKHGRIITADFSEIWANPKITELAFYAVDIKHFQCCWAQDEKTGSRFLERLANEPQSTLFEIFIALQYCFAGYHVGLIPEFKGETTPDIVVSHHQGFVLVECMNKKPNPGRENIIDKLIFDLTEGGIYKKVREQIRDWRLPLILAIKVPEEINWLDKSLEKRLSEQIIKRVYTDLCSDYEFISFVMFSSGLDPSLDVNRRGEFQTDKLTFAFMNRNAKYQIPGDFRLHGTLSEKEREELLAKR
jgi:hypothetical protein